MPITLTRGVGSGGAVVAAGDVAHDSPDAGNPVKVGGKATTATPAPVATGDRVDAWFGLAGQIVVSPSLNSDADTRSGRLWLDPGGTGVVAAVSCYVYNGATWDRNRSASAANLSGNTALGAALIARPGEWTVTSAPAVNTVATVTKAAGGAGVRNVCTGIFLRARGGVVAPAAIQLTAHLRDGATGVGTPLLSFTLVLPATVGGGDDVQITGLNVVGSAATAMTLEFTAAGGANTFESVGLSGFTCQ